MLVAKDITGSRLLKKLRQIWLNLPSWACQILTEENPLIVSHGVMASPCFWGPTGGKASGGGGGGDLIIQHLVIYTLIFRFGMVLPCALMEASCSLWKLRSNLHKEWCLRVCWDTAAASDSLGSQRIPRLVSQTAFSPPSVAQCFFPGILWYLMFPVPEPPENSVRRWSYLLTCPIADLASGFLVFCVLLCFVFPARPARTSASPFQLLKVWCCCLLSIPSILVGFCPVKNKTCYCGVRGVVEERDQTHSYMRHLDSEGLSPNVLKSASLKHRAHSWWDPDLPSDDRRPYKCMFIASQSSCHFRITESGLCICFSSYPWLQFALLLTETLERDKIKRKSEHLCAKYSSFSGQKLDSGEETVVVGWEMWGNAAV